MKGASLGPRQLALALGVSAGARVPPTAQVSTPRSWSTRGPQGPEAFLPEVQPSPGARGLATSHRDWAPWAGAGEEGPGQLPFTRIPGRLEPVQPQGPQGGYGLSWGQVCGEMGSGVPCPPCVWVAGSQGARGGGCPLSAAGAGLGAQGTTSAASRGAAPRLSPGPGPAPPEWPVGAGQTGLLPSAVHIDEQDVLVRAVAGPGLLEVADAGAAHSCCGRRPGRSARGASRPPPPRRTPSLLPLRPCEPLTFPPCSRRKRGPEGRRLA